MSQVLRKVTLMTRRSLGDLRRHAEKRRADARRIESSEVARSAQAAEEGTGDPEHADAKRRTREVEDRIALLDGLSMVPPLPSRRRWSPRGASRGDVANLVTQHLQRLSVDGDLRPAIASLPAGESRLMVELTLPGPGIVPHALAYRYRTTTNEVVEIPRPPSERRARYTDLVARSALRALALCFSETPAETVDSVEVTLVTEAVDRVTGANTCPALLSVRTTRARFETLDLANVDAVACLRGLHAVMSPSPGELVPIRPISTLDREDRRFIADDDVLSGLDDRPDLLELTPLAFEALIANLFTHMGLDTRLTQASRDGGVDSVAFDLRPVVGGKFVIQAKRYRGTVEVSAVRDLYGTVLNEGASKGILVTTSGYGPSAYEFAAGKPLELLTGAHLLSLLDEFTGVQARIGGDHR